MDGYQTDPQLLIFTWSIKSHELFIIYFILWLKSVLISFVMFGPVHYNHSQSQLLFQSYSLYSRFPNFLGSQSFSPILGMKDRLSLLGKHEQEEILVFCHVILSYL